MPKYKRILRKLALISLVIILIYFLIGALASIAMIVIESTTHQMSSEIQQDTPSFKPWLIYLGMTVMLLMCLGFTTVAYFGYKAVKKIGQPKLAKTNSIEEGLEVY